jgi:hypothetical protein
MGPNALPAANSAFITGQKLAALAVAKDANWPRITAILTIVRSQQSRVVEL